MMKKISSMFECCLTTLLSAGCSTTAAVRLETTGEGREVTGLVSRHRHALTPHTSSFSSFCSSSFSSCTTSFSYSDIITKMLD